jgi:hypothetical protein
MAPDFEYFLRMNVQGIYGHTIAGIFYFDIPVALILAFLFHSVVKKNLIDSMPVFFQSRFSEVRHSNFREYFKDHKLIFIGSVILGTATHIIWDGFTHQRQFFVEAFPQIYEGRTIPFLGAKYPLWYALQFMSTIVGGTILTVYVLFMKPAPGSYQRISILYWVLLALIITVTVAIRMQFKVINEMYVVLVISTISAFCIGITILGLASFRRHSAGTLS